MATEMETEEKVLNEPLNVLITGAAGAIGYSLIPLFANGLVFGPDQPINLRLLEIDVPKIMQSLNGVVMEIRDGAYPLVLEIIPTSDPQVAFAGADYCVLVGGRPRGPGMDRADLLKANASIFQQAGRVLEEVGKVDTKVLVVANPANTNCFICAHNAPKIPKENFCALTRLDMNRATSQLAERLGVGAGAVKNVIIWGNHSKTQVPDILSACTVDGVDNLSEALAAKLEDDAPGPWERPRPGADSGLIHDVQFRGKAVIDMRGSSSAMSAANGIKDCLRSWHCGTPPGEHVAMAVWSNGNPYGIADEVFYSFPCACDGNGNYAIVPDINVDEQLRDLMTASAAELEQERQIALEFLG